MAGLWEGMEHAAQDASTLVLQGVQPLAEVEVNFLEGVEGKRPRQDMPAHSRVQEASVKPMELLFLMLLGRLTMLTAPLQLRNMEFQGTQDLVQEKDQVLVKATVLLRKAMELLLEVLALLLGVMVLLLVRNMELQVMQDLVQEKVLELWKVTVLQLVKNMEHQEVLVTALVKSPLTPTLLLPPTTLPGEGELDSGPVGGLHLSVVVVSRRTVPR